MEKYNLVELDEICKAYIEEHGKDYNYEYKKFTISKSNGQKRTIYAPSPRLMELQKIISYFLNGLYKPRQCVHGFIKGRSIVTNAKQHIKNHSVLKIDIEKFFESITTSRIKGLLLALGLEDGLAQAITTICTMNNILPTGSPASPVLANMICHRLDKELARLSKIHKITYTRYGDDMTFSGYGKHFFNSILRSDSNGGYIISEQLKKIIKDNGFSINERKTGFFGKDKSHYITGIKVNKKLKLARAYYKNLEAILHMVERYGHEDTAKRFYENIAPKRYSNRVDYALDFRQFILGKISYIGMIQGADSKSYKAYMKIFDKLFNEIGKIEECVYVMEWIIDDPLLQGLSDFCGQGTCFSLDGVGLVTAAHVLPCDDTIKYLKNRNILSIKRANDGQVTTLSTDNIMCRIPDIDIAVIKFNNNDSKKLLYNSDYVHSTAKNVKLIGFPSYRNGDSVTITHSTIISQSRSNGIRKIEVKDGIVGGMSGGPVLDMDDKVVGVIHKGNTGGAGVFRHYYIPISSMLHIRRSPCVHQAPELALAQHEIQ